MWRNNKLCQQLNIEHPIILAPMASATTPELVGAVSNAGGLGSFGAAGTSPDRLRQVIRAIRQQTAAPFNVNLFVPDWEPLEVDANQEARMAEILAPFHGELDAGAVPAVAPMFDAFEERLEVAVEEKAPIISFHFGATAAAVQKAKSAGATVMSSATTVAEARLLTDLGIDIIIAQGSEAGGHRGTFAGDWQQSLIGSLALIPQIVDAVNVPVVAAGGIMDGRGMAACLALGASGVQMGTAFLACPENNIAPAYRQSILAAADADPAVTKVFSGKPARGLKNRYLDEMSQHEDALLPFPAQYSIYRGLRDKATAAGVSDFLPMWAGQGVGMATDQPASELVAQVIAQARRTLAGMQDM